MAIPKWPKNADEWRGALLFAIILPLLTFVAFLFPFQQIVRVAAPPSIPGWRIDIFFRLCEMPLAVAILICSAILCVLAVIYSFIDRPRAFWAYLVLLISLAALVIAPALTPAVEKPVIYLYPQHEQPVHVSLEYPGRITESEPSYADDGWWVTAWPDGTLRDATTGERHRFLFWEGRDRLSFRMDTGFVVAGSQSEQFLREKLAIMGLSGTEMDDFVEYWLPRLAAHPYNLVSFPNEEYAAAVRLNVEPAPKTVIRVFMVFRGLESPIEIPPQTLRGQERRGFTVVEWGGTELE